MDDLTRTPPKRRALLQRSALLIGGALGLGATAHAGAPKPPEATLRLLGRRRSRTGVARGANPSAYGDLTRETGGPKVGTFHSSGLGQGGAPHGLAAAPALELQTFSLDEGTLFGLGAKGRDGERTCAVLGGTGRFAAASGTYSERPASGADAARGAVEFVFTLKG